jgi:hypothetical protein
MKNLCQGVIFLFAAFLVIGCERADDRDAQTSESDIKSRKIATREHPPDSNSIQIAEDMLPEMKSGPHEKETATYSDKFPVLKSMFSLEKLRTPPREALWVEWRSIISSIAAEKGAEESEVLAEFYRAYPDADAMQTLLGQAYADRPMIAVDSYLKGLEGQRRSNALSSFASTLGDNKNIEGLEEMYHIVPPGQDRWNVASSLVNSTCRVHGVDFALNSLQSLDLEEERRIALTGLVSVIKRMEESPSRAELENLYKVSREYDRENMARSKTSHHLERE